VINESSRPLKAAVDEARELVALFDEHAKRGVYAFTRARWWTRRTSPAPEAPGEAGGGVRSHDGRRVVENPPRRAVRSGVLER